MKQLTAMSTQTNLEIILDQFENGERRYGEDPNFKSAVDSLKMGLGVYAVLDHYIKENNRLRETILKRDRRIDELVNECAILNDFISNMSDLNCRK